LQGRMVTATGDFHGKQKNGKSSKNREPRKMSQKQQNGENEGEGVPGKKGAWWFFPKGKKGHHTNKRGKALLKSPCFWGQQISSRRKRNGGKGKGGGDVVPRTGANSKKKQEGWELKGQKGNKREVRSGKKKSYANPLVVTKKKVETGDHQLI